MARKRQKRRKASRVEIGVKHEILEALETLCQNDRKSYNKLIKMYGEEDVEDILDVSQELGVITEDQRGLIDDHYLPYVGDLLVRLKKPLQKVKKKKDRLDLWADLGMNPIKSVAVLGDKIGRVVYLHLITPKVDDEIIIMKGALGEDKKFVNGVRALHRRHRKILKGIDESRKRKRKRRK